MLGAGPLPQLGHSVRQGFESRGDVDAITENIVAVDHDIAEIDADTELDALFGWAIGIPLRHLLLHIDRAAHCVDDAGELDE